MKLPDERIEELAQLPFLASDCEILWMADEILEARKKTNPEGEPNAADRQSQS